jgi:abelson tyrosine-protein kinase 1
MILPIPEINTPSKGTSISSLFTSVPDDKSDSLRHSYGGYESPPPLSKDISDRRDEQRYRLRLLLSMPQNSFHKSRTFFSFCSRISHRRLLISHPVSLPLWSPQSLVQIGAVGFLRKPEGEFVTLFNAMDPSKSSEGTVRGMPSIYGYGRVSTSQQQASKRSAFQMSMDTIQGFFRMHTPGRRYTYPLRRGHKAAYLCTESTVYSYMESVDAAKKWFKGNVKDVVKLFGHKHRIQREDIFLGMFSSQKLSLAV